MGKSFGKGGYGKGGYGGKGEKGNGGKSYKGGEGGKGYGRLSIPSSVLGNLSWDTRENYQNDHSQWQYDEWRAGDQPLDFVLFQCDAAEEEAAATATGDCKNLFVMHSSVEGIEADKVKRSTGSPRIFSSGRYHVLGNDDNDDDDDGLDLEIPEYQLDESDFPELGTAA